MKTLIPWLAALLAAGGAFYFHNAEQKAAQTIAVLQPQVQELESLRAENEQLKTNQVSSFELERLRKDSADALKLRNDVQLLRGEQTKLKQQAQAAQNQAQQVQAQARAFQAQLLSRKPSPPSSEAFTTQNMINACINNLRQMDAAKQQWALENRKTGNDTPTAGEVGMYLKDNVIPACPAGGQYTIGRVNEDPTCSIPDHKLPPP